MNHITQAKLAIKDFLLAELPAVLEDADAQADDGVTTPPPFKVHRSEKADLEGYPAIELIATDSQPVVDSTAQIYQHRVMVAHTVAGDDEETLTTQSERYMWALRQLFDDRLFEPPLGTGPIYAGVEQYTPVAQPPGLEVPFVRGGYLEIFVRTLE